MAGQLDRDGQLHRLGQLDLPGLLCYRVDGIDRKLLDGDPVKRLLSCFDLMRRLVPRRP